ncbi:MAG TPA: hypothetical protein VHB48_08055, partial [Chitinophagaceae bacterium]|nr:hypothetical protein [Chitinophagaceae bacterium]
LKFRKNIFVQIAAGQDFWREYLTPKDKNVNLKCYFFKNFFQKSGHPPPFSIYRCKYSFYALPFTACTGAGEI